MRSILQISALPVQSRLVTKIQDNTHVIEENDFAVKSLAEFNYQYNEFGMPSMSVFFELKPDVFFKTNAALDYTVVAVNQISVNKNRNLKDFGYLKLYDEPAKALVTEHLSIIQHPGGGYKQIALRENRLMSAVGNFVTYSTDTTQGSSGSCVFNDQWQVIALHHSGVPRKDNNGYWLKRDGTIWQNGEDDSLIDWISNEGVRISVIVADLKNTHSQDALFNELLNAPVVMPKVSTNENFVVVTDEMNEENPPNVENHSENNIQQSPENKGESKIVKTKENENEQNSITVTIPIEVTVRVGTGSVPQTASAMTDKKVDETEESSVKLTESIAPNYNGRNGYNSDFVKKDGFKIELLELLEGQSSKLAPLLNPTPDNQYILNYFNFSVVLNKFRKLCAITAVNIDGSQSQQLGRENNPWILDPRVDTKYQAGPAVYKNNDLDRGHMVRRLDPVWGVNAVAANDDTFHLTNSTPQHKNLNQKEWLRLEDFILGGADDENIKISIFTGPIFGDADIPYRGILVPLQFYKVAAMIKKDGTPSVSGYMLAQPDEIEDFRDLEGIKETGFGQFKTYQVPIAKIAKLTGLKFDKFIEFDPLGNVALGESTNRIEISSQDDIKL